MGRLEAATLIDCDIDQDGTRLHGLQHVTAHELRRAALGPERSDYRSARFTICLMASRVEKIVRT